LKRIASPVKLGQALLLTTQENYQTSAIMTDNVDRIEMTNRHVSAHLPDDQYQPGSEGYVLRNKRGIIDPVIMGEAETNALWMAQSKLIGVVTSNQSFTALDVCEMHRLWLAGIYPWAGKPRSVNISKGGFDFPKARFVPALLDEFERKQLYVFTPCRFSRRDEIERALAEVYVALLLIHPFLKGNGRLGRMLITLMALQGGLPLLDFTAWNDEKQEEYFAAVRAGLARDYLPMKRLFAEVIKKSLQIG
jgi:cell filamentation protein